MSSPTKRNQDKETSPAKISAVDPMESANSSENSTTPDEAPPPSGSITEDGSTQQQDQAREETATSEKKLQVNETAPALSLGKPAIHIVKSQEDTPSNVDPLVSEYTNQDRPRPVWARANARPRRVFPPILRFNGRSNANKNASDGASSSSMQRRAVPTRTNSSRPPTPSASSPNRTRKHPSPTLRPRSSRELRFSSRQKRPSSIRRSSSSSDSISEAPSEARLGFRRSYSESMALLTAAAGGNLRQYREPTSPGRPVSRRWTSDQALLEAPTRTDAEMEAFFRLVDEWSQATWRAITGIPQMIVGFPAFVAETFQKLFQGLLGGRQENNRVSHGNDDEDDEPVFE